jgi:hypothetical protein
MRLRLLLSIAVSLCVFTARSEDWPQFRGPGGRAVSETATPPIGFGPSSNLLWKVAIPEGISSPIVTGERIFLTAPDETLALDRKDGRILWRRPLGSGGNPRPTPVTDGKFLYVFFRLDRGDFV